MKTPLISRRNLVAGAAAIGTVTAGSLMLPTTVNAVPDFQNSQVAGYYRFKLGDFEITVLTDGSYNLPTNLMATNVPREKVVAYLKANFLDPDQRLSHVNIPLINTGKDLILIDVGGGPNWMPTAGRLADNLEAAGYSPEDVTKVILTHGHPDHIWALYDEFEEAPRYPNAKYYITAPEWDFWTGDRAMAELAEGFKGFAIGAKKHLNAIKDMVEPIKAGSEIIPGFLTVDTAGHTVGHMSILISSKGETLFVTSDVITHPYVSFEHPGWRPLTDFDQEAGEKSRRMALDMAATDKNLILSYHISFPGLGRVARVGNHYRYVPETWRWDL